MAEYNDESIRLLRGAQRVRKRSEMYLGSHDLEGVKQTFNEIAGNSIDERLAGFGDKLDVCRYEDNSYSIRDYGRGVPLGWNNSEQSWNYINIYEELHGGAKFNEDACQEILQKIDANNAWDTFKFSDYPYMIAIGLNGVGAAATQATSEYATAISYRDGKASRMDYEKGEHSLDELIIEDYEGETGTFFKWKPDPEVFSNVDIPVKWLKDYCKMLSYIGEFNVTFNDCGEVTEYPQTTLLDVMKERAGVGVYGEKFLHTKDGKGRILICQCKAVMGSSGKSEFYNNKMRVKGGVHESAIDAALGDYFSNISKERGIRIQSRDYTGKFSFIIETLANEVGNHGQTKDFIDDAYVYSCIRDCVYNLIQTEASKGTDWFYDIVEEVVQNAQNRIAVAEMAKSIREIEKSTGKRAKASPKFAPCEAYKDGRYEEVEWFVVEGDSAGEQGKVSRDAMYQCIQKIRGKSLNIYKAPIAKLIANAEIRDIIISLGCGIDLGIDEYETFDISKLKVSRIYFLTDADIDGLHIRMLLFVIFYKLFPELLYNGYVHIVEVPLYTVHMYDNTSVYAVSEEDLAKIKEERGSEIMRVSRFKGLGEMDPEDLWETGFNPETRRTRQIKIDRDDTEVADVLEILFGKSTERRKRAILGGMMGENFDTAMGSIEELVDYICSLDMSNVDVEEVVM